MGGSDEEGGDSKQERVGSGKSSALVGVEQIGGRKIPRGERVRKPCRICREAMIADSKLLDDAGFVDHKHSSLADEGRSILFVAPRSAKILASFRADSLFSKGCHHAANQFSESQSAATVPEAA